MKKEDIKLKITELKNELSRLQISFFKERILSFAIAANSKNILSKKATLIKNKLDSFINLGYSQPFINTLTSIFEEILEEKIGSSTGYKTGSVVIPLSNPNGHNYNLNEPLLLHSKNGSNLGILSIGRFGNTTLPMSYPGAWRYATVEEVAKFLDSRTPEYWNFISTAFNDAPEFKD